MEKWPLGVFASIDAGLGVHLDVASELGVKTLQLHAPRPESRRRDRANEFARRLLDLGMTATCVFGGFEDESYADIPTVRRTVGLVPPATREHRLREMREIADFARWLDVSAVGLHVGFVPHNNSEALYGEVVAATS